MIILRRRSRTTETNKTKNEQSIIVMKQHIMNINIISIANTHNNSHNTNKRKRRIIQTHIHKMSIRRTTTQTIAIKENNITRNSKNIRRTQINRKNKTHHPPQP